MSQWEYVEQVPRDIRKAGLDKRERVTVDKALSRVAAGQTLPRDVKHLRGEISEVRITANRRELRLLFARIDHGLVLLGLCFFQKQSRTTPKDLIDLAESRLVQVEGQLPFDWYRFYPIILPRPQTRGLTWATRIFPGSSV